MVLPPSGTEFSWVVCRDSTLHHITLHGTWCTMLTLCNIQQWRPPPIKVSPQNSNLARVRPDTLCTEYCCATWWIILGFSNHPDPASCSEGHQMHELCHRNRGKAIAKSRTCWSMEEWGDCYWLHTHGPVCIMTNTHGPMCIMTMYSWTYAPKLQ